MSVRFLRPFGAPLNVDRGIPGSARISRAGDAVLGIANFSFVQRFQERLFWRDAKTSTRDACATQNTSRNTPGFL
jgi:hypothetical protein